MSNSCLVSDDPPWPTLQLQQHNLWTLSHQYYWCCCCNCWICCRTAFIATERPEILKSHSESLLLEIESLESSYCVSPAKATGMTAITRALLLLLLETDGLVVLEESVLALVSLITQVITFYYFCIYKSFTMSIMALSESLRPVD